MLPCEGKPPCEGKVPAPLFRGASAPAYAPRARDDVGPDAVWILHDNIAMLAEVSPSKHAPALIDLIQGAGRRQKSRTVIVWRPW